MKAIDEYINGLSELDPIGLAIFKSIRIIEEALLKFELSSLILSFNGGKDACVIFQLVRYVLWKQGKLVGFGSEEWNCSGIKLVYFADPKLEFPEILQFLDDTRIRYNVKYIELGNGFKDGMQDLVNNHSVAGVFMGVRVGDPHVDNIVDPFQCSSKNWPKFMRIYPILHWSYSQVWTFLRQCQLPYCILYDQGYTSIGNILNTVPNPALAILPENIHTGTCMDACVESSYDNSVIRYHPAYMLLDESLERNNRK